MTISLMLRSRPEALLLLNRELQDNAPAFSTPGRIPFLLWVVQQAARSEYFSRFQSHVSSVFEVMSLLDFSMPAHDIHRDRSWSYASTVWQSQETWPLLLFKVMSLLYFKVMSVLCLNSQQDTSMSAAHCLSIPAHGIHHDRWWICVFSAFPSLLSLRFWSHASTVCQVNKTVRISLIVNTCPRHSHNSSWHQLA